MATRRSRLQIKPNIAGKTSVPKPVVEDKSVPISAELATGAATAVIIRKEPGVQKSPGKQGSVSEKNDNRNATDILTSSKSDLNQLVVPELKQGSSSNPIKGMPFTRLKRFGLNLGSKDLLTNSSTQGNEHPSGSSPQHNQRSIRSPPVKPISNGDGLQSDSTTDKLPTSITRNSNVPNIHTGSPSNQIPSQRDSLIISVQRTTVTEDSTKLLQAEKIDIDADKPRVDRSSTGSTLKPGSVVQRLPFRSRLPKVKPNIDALRLKNKNLMLSGKDDNSRPSSPMKSQRPGKSFVAMKSPQPAPKMVSSEDNDQIQKHPPIQHSPVTSGSKEGNPEGRKRHLSTSSVSSVNSDSQNSAMYVIQTSPKIDYAEDEPLDRNVMRMGDLIYWNPVKNPMTNPVTPKKKAKLDKEKENVCIQETTKEQQEKETASDKGGKDMPVPQVKIGPDGSIILNEESLVIQKPDEEVMTEVIEEHENTATYNSFRKPANRIGWSEWETEKFYRALSYLGTDFSLMIKLFPNRSRCDIKTKFKREDKLNKNKVDFALKNKKPFDMSFFKREEELDKEQEERKKKEYQEKVKKLKQTRAEKQKEKKKMKELEQEDNYSVLEGDGSRHESVSSDMSDIEMMTPVKQSIRFPFKRYDSMPFVPPFCLPQQEDSEGDTLETQICMSDSEIMSPQKPSRSEFTDRPINSAAFPPNTNVQYTQLTDTNNSPLVLVYHTPEDGKGETVIHVYQLQNNQLSNFSNIQIPLNDGSSIVELPSLQTVAGRLSSEQGQSGEENSSIQESMPFIISSGDDPQSGLMAQPIMDSIGGNHVTTDNEDYLNIIDINASKITTPRKDDSNSDVSGKGLDSFYQVVRIEPDHDLESDDSRLSPVVSIDNEFVASDIDIKYSEHLTENLHTTQGKRRQTSGNR